jgi:hypothetical protein
MVCGWIELILATVFPSLSVKDGIVTVTLLLGRIVTFLSDRGNPRSSNNVTLMVAVDFPSAAILVDGSTDTIDFYIDTFS